MSKELTEQWRNGMLPVGHYYCKLYYNGFKEKIQECVKSAYSLKSCIPMSCGCEGEEVLAPVPTYDQFSQMVKKVAELEYRLKEANKTLMYVAAIMTCDPADMLETYPDFCADQWALDAINKYLEKYGVEK